MININKGIAYKLLLTLGLAILVALSGCKSTPKKVSVGPMSIGPGSQSALGSTKRTYTYNSKIFMDVVVPVFDPGFPKDHNQQVDYDEIDEQGIWPQLRRAEAKRFAIQTKKALEDIGTFGSVSVTPSSNASGDLFILGSVDYSDSETVKITATVVDASGSVWGSKEFEHVVSKGFYRDSLNKDKNPYNKIFSDIGDYTYDLLKSKNESEKLKIKNLANIRYAQMYSPDVFGQYTSISSGVLQLTGMPNDNNLMMQRISALKSQDQMFVDKLQEQYLVFDESTKEAYRTWQRETLPEAVAAREAEEDRTTSAIFGSVLTVAAVLLNENSDSSAGDIGKVAAGLGAAYFVKDTLDKNAELKVHKASLDEIGENLDITLSPSVMQFDESVVELTGTAGEQFEQWRAHLKKIYDLEYSSVTL